MDRGWSPVGMAFAPSIMVSNFHSQFLHLLLFFWVLVYKLSARGGTY